MIICIDDKDKLKLEDVLIREDIDFSWLDKTNDSLFNSVLNIVDLDGTVMSRIYKDKAKEMIDFYCKELEVCDSLKREYLLRLDSLAETFFEYSLSDETMLEVLTEEFLEDDEYVINFNEFSDVNEVMLYMLGADLDFTTIYNTLVNNVEEMLDAFDISEEDLKIEIIDSLEYCGYGAKAIEKFGDKFDMLIA